MLFLIAPLLLKVILFQLSSYSWAQWISYTNSILGVYKVWNHLRLECEKFQNIFSFGLSTRSITQKQNIEL
jgi:hypothetical protein